MTCLYEGQRMQTDNFFPPKPQLYHVNTKGIWAKCSSHHSLRKIPQLCKKTCDDNGFAGIFRTEQCSLQIKE